jgi:flagellar biogenesis protein FliO
MKNDFGIKGIGVLAGLVLAGPRVGAADAASPAAATLSHSGSELLALFRVGGALLLVLAVFFAGLWFWKNWQGLLTNKGRAPKLNVLEAKSLGQRHTLYVVGYERQRILLSASPGGVTMLATLPAVEAMDQQAAMNDAPAQDSSFAAMLLRAVSLK